MRPRRNARAVLTTLLVAGALAILPVPAAAAEPLPGTPLPGEPPVTTLPRGVNEGLTIDLDGDSARELLTVSGAEDAGGLAAIQAWWVAADGSAEPSNQVRLRRSASVDELLSGRGRLGIDRDDMIAVRTDEPAKFLIARRDGREVPLVATIGTSIEFDVPCCLTIWEVVIEGRRLDLRLVADTARYAAELAAVDLDADGTDELFLLEGPKPGEESPILDLALLRWTGEGYERTGFTVEFQATCCGAQLLDVGETDGLDGEEVLFAGYDPDLLRLTMRSGEPVVERAGIGIRGDVRELSAARALDLPRGPSVLILDAFSDLGLWSWPRDEPPEWLIGRGTGGFQAAILGRGAATRILVTTGFPPTSVLVYDGDLGLSGPGAPITIGQDTRAGAFISAVGSTLVPPFASPPMPFFGPVPGGLLGAAEAYVFSGTVIRPAAGRAVDPDSRPIALLPGLEVIGPVGPGGSWTVLLTEFGAVFEDSTRPTVVSLFASRALGEARIASTESITRPEANGSHLEPTWYGVAFDPARSQTLLVGQEAVEAEITAPPGTVVAWSVRGNAPTVTVGPGGTARIPIIEAAGPDAPEGSGATARLFAITPSGHAYYGTWRILVYRQPPALAFSEDLPLVDFAPTLSGQTVPGATVTVGGQPAEVAPDGTFTAPIDVGILPTELRVVAIDPIGNRTERVVSRVWPLDYRQLPFVPLAVVLTIAVGVLLFLRKPEAGPDRRRPNDGATFEEIGG